MRINEVYATRSQLFPGPMNCISRLVLIREFDSDTVTFSVANEEDQPHLETGIIRFYTSAFKVRRDFFTEHFELLNSGVPVYGGAL